MLFITWKTNFMGSNHWVSVLSNQIVFHMPIYLFSPKIEVNQATVVDPGFGVQEGTN